MVQSNTTVIHSLSRDRIVELGGSRQGPCVTVYTPLETAGTETRQNEIRISNQASEAAEMFERSGLKADEAKKIVLPLTEIATQMEDPSGQRYPGLVSFLSPEESEVFASPLRFEERTIGGSRFITRHLLPMLDAPQVVYTLALSLGEAKLYEMTRETQEDISPKEMPGSLQALEAFEDPEKSIQQHSPDSGGDATVFHGHGGAKDSGDQLEEDYIRAVAEAVNTFLESRNGPLLIASTEELQAQYLQFNRYKDVIEDGLTGNFEHRSPAQLRDDAWEVMDARTGDRATEIRERFLNFASSAPDSVVRGVLPIVSLAYQGRVSELLFPETLQTSGLFDAETGEAEEVHEGVDDALVDDLVDLAAVLALQNGGEVHAVPDPNNGDGGLPQEMVAVLRS